MTVRKAGMSATIVGGLVLGFLLVVGTPLLVAILIRITQFWLFVLS